jgi:Fe-S cluster biogenesis protein NfuA
VITRQRLCSGKSCRASKAGDKPCLPRKGEPVLAGFALTATAPSDEDQHPTASPETSAPPGRTELAAVEGATAYLRLGGGCQGCGMATVTLSQGIEVAITQAIPEIIHVVDVTDHASGTNPYFEPAKK